MDIEDDTAILDSAIQKYQGGERKYGRYDPTTDARDCLREAEAEILDTINYLAMFLMKLRATRPP